MWVGEGPIKVKCWKKKSGWTFFATCTHSHLYTHNTLPSKYYLSMMANSIFGCQNFWVSVDITTTACILNFIRHLCFSGEVRALFFMG